MPFTLEFIKGFEGVLPHQPHSWDFVPQWVGWLANFTTVKIAKLFVLKLPILRILISLFRKIKFSN